MTNDLFLILFAVSVIVIVGVVLIIQQNRGKKVEKEISALARELRLKRATDKNGKPLIKITGDRRGRHVVLKQNTNNGKAREYSVELQRPISNHIIITAKSDPELSASKDGLKETTTGDAPFDESLRVRSTDAAAVKSKLVENVRASIRQLMNSQARSRVDIQADYLSFVEPGLLSDPNERQHVRERIDALIDLAQALDKAGS